MRISFDNHTVKIFARASFFLAALVLIVQLFPKRDSFRYTYTIGHPWNYSLLTAPFSFPILKDSTLLADEQARILKDFTPYFRIDRNVADRMSSSLRGNVEEGEAKEFLLQSLSYIYDRGVLSFADLDSLKAHGNQRIALIADNRTASVHTTDSFFTVQTAYEYIMNSHPAGIPQAYLQQLDINRFIAENIFLDQDITSRGRKELLHSVSNTNGMVQAGERIIDRGEIVTQRTAQILLSLEIASKENVLESDSSDDENKNSLPHWRQNLSSVQLSPVLSSTGQVLLVGILLLQLFLYLYMFRPNIFNKMRDLLFILTMTIIPVVLVVLMVRYTARSVYYFPFALVPLVVRTFFDPRTALFTHFIVVLLTALFTFSPAEFILLQILAGMTAVAALRDLTTRAQLARAGAFVFVCYLGAYVGYALLTSSSLASIDPYRFLAFGVSSLLLLFAYGIIYLVERAFGYLSPVSLVELSNVNTPLLLRFSETAPGTFQHSLQVANLVTDAAKEIGANGLLARIGALYHDIGKLPHPEYFTENQLSGFNPLSSLKLQDASKRIINHVTEGYKIAKAHNLPQPVLEFIRTHHGTSRTAYFYNTWINTHPDEKLPDDAFRYEGPNPYTKEQVLLMMADAVEATSRSLTEWSDASIDQLVDRIIDHQLSEGLYAKAPITFADIDTVKATFKAKLKTIYHTRIAYPSVETKHE
ncbi:MAG: HDIG domain-containing protein [Paludibacteraceae bacterium]|nr:HDIG domain-containing protein [Paludibacteraceae bacterium]